MQAKFFRFTIIATLLFTLTIAAHADFAVKVIYFKPINSEHISTNKITKMVEEAQDLYASEMELQGFERKTFKLEKDEHDKVIIHQIQGRNKTSYYIHNTWEKLAPELPSKFNPNTPPWEKKDDIRLIIIGGVTAVEGGAWGIGFPYHSGYYGGTALIAGESGHLNMSVIAHELGHTFGLYHKPPGTDPDPPSLEHYEARWLDKHYHFNNNIKDTIYPSITGKPTFTSINDEKVSLNIDISSQNKLYQAKVIAANNVLIIGWQYFYNESQNTIQIIMDRSKWQKNIAIQIMDSNGNIHQSKTYSINLPTLNENDVYLTLTGGSQPIPNDLGLNPINPKSEWLYWGVVGENLTNNSNPLIIDGKQFERGISLVPSPDTNPGAILRYDLTGGAYRAFKGYLGLSDEADVNIGTNANPSCNVGGSVVFHFEIDNNNIYSSKKITGEESVIEVKFNIPENSKELQIIVKNADDTNWCDGAIIGDAKLIRETLNISEPISYKTDVNNDGYIDLSDVMIVRSGIRNSVSYDTDINDDGITDETDLRIVKEEAIEAIAAAAPSVIRRKRLTTWGELKSID